MSQTSHGYLGELCSVSLDCGIYLACHRCIGIIYGFIKHSENCKSILGSKLLPHHHDIFYQLSVMKKNLLSVLSATIYMAAMKIKERSNSSSCSFLVFLPIQQIFKSFGTIFELPFELNLIGSFIFHVCRRPQTACPICKQTKE